MPYSINGGVRIHYEVEGEGTPIILCHGLFGSLEVWHIFGWVDGLRDRFQLVLIDCRGHGISDKPHDPAAYRTELMVGDVISVMNDLDIVKAHYLGYSMGGQIGWCIGRYAADRFNSLIIGGAPPYVFDPNLPNPNINLYGPILKKGNEAYIAFIESSGKKVLLSMRKIYLNNDPEAIMARLRRVESIRYEDTVATNKLPCLLYVGEDDPVYGQAKARVNDFTNLTFLTLPGLDHYQTNQRSDLILPHVIKFIADIEAGSKHHEK